MRRRVAAVSLLLLLASSCGGAANETAPTPAPAKSGSYTNARFGFSLTLPSGWSHEESTNGDGITVDAGDDGSDIRVYAAEKTEPPTERADDPAFKQHPVNLTNGERANLWVGVEDERTTYELVYIREDFTVHFLAQMSKSFFERNRQRVYSTLKTIDAPLRRPVPSETPAAAAGCSVAQDGQVCLRAGLLTLRDVQASANDFTRLPDVEPVSLKDPADRMVYCKIPAAGIRDEVWTALHDPANGYGLFQVVAGFSESGARDFLTEAKRTTCREDAEAQDPPPIGDDSAWHRYTLEDGSYGEVFYVRVGSFVTAIFLSHGGDLLGATLPFVLVDAASRKLDDIRP